MRVGIIGFGKMGRAMGERLVDCGHDVVAWARDPAKLADVPSIGAIATPADIVANVDIILSVLANDAATEAAYFGADGLCTIDLGGTIIIEICTMSPDRARHLAQAVEARGGRFLECPVGGTVKPARDGALVGLAAGDEDVFGAVKPLLQQLTRRLDYLGPVGNGAAMKLAINLPLMVYWGALGEAVGLLKSRGIPIEQAFDILTDSSGAIGPAKARQTPIIDLITTGQSGVSNFAVTQALKDMALMRDLAAAEGVECPIITAAETTAKQASKGGWDAKDVSLLAAWRSV